MAWKYFIVLLVALVSQVSCQNCPEPNGFFKDPQSCDGYTECKDGVAEKLTCPDGLMFNDKLTEYPRYPCSYPQEVECGARTRTQAADPTEGCPHQYGMYRADDRAESCGKFRNCVAGVAHMNECPEGLAFNPDKIRCDYPDEVPGCDNGAFIKYQCPGTPIDADLGHPRYSDPDDCRKFYVCVENTKPRPNSCSVGYVFNPDLGVCDEPQNVPKCANYYPKEVLDAIQALRKFDNRLI